MHDPKAAAKRPGKRRRSSHGDYVAIVSHEMRGPLAAICGFTETLLDGASGKSPAGSPGERTRFLKIIERQARRLKALVEDLLVISVLESGEKRRAPETLDLGRAVRLTITDLRSFARSRRIRVEEDIPKGLSTAFDKSQLSQVLQNVLHNAIKYSHRRGRIRIGGSRRDGCVTIVVRDQGIGIERGDLKKVFGRFHRTAGGRHHASGSGLGLSIVAQILAGYKCRIWAESAVGKGSTFRFTLPVGLSVKAGPA